MSSRSVPRHPFRCCLVLGAMLLSAGCGTRNVYYAAGQAPVEIPSDRIGYEDPDRYRIDPDAAPTYTATRAFTPPLPREGKWESKIPNVEILPNEVWHATHKVGDQLLIFSPAYQERQCQELLRHGKFSGAFRDPLSGRCKPDYLYHLIVSADGRVSGWLLLRNPADVFFAKDRYADMNLALREGPGWPDQPLFEHVTAK